MTKGGRGSYKQASMGIQGFVINLSSKSFKVFGGCAACRLRLVQWLIELWLSKLWFKHFGKRKDKWKQFTHFLHLVRIHFILLLKIYGKDLLLIKISWLATFEFSCKKIDLEIHRIHREKWNQFPNICNQ